MSDRPPLVEIEALKLLREIRDGVNQIAAALAAAEQRRTPRRLSPADEEMLRTLLPAIKAAIENRTFSVHELFEHAGLNVEPAIALREALVLIGNPRKTGRLLRRGADFDVCGYRIVANGPSRDGMSWTCYRSSPQKPAKPAALSDTA